jgi:hypothetical protein
MRRHLNRWGAIYLLLVFFLVSWVAQAWTMSIEAMNDAATHHEAFEWATFWPQFLASTFENWQSEWLQLLVQGVVLLGMKHLIFAADAEDMETVQRDLVDIKRALGLPTDDPGEHHTTRSA